MRWTFALLLAGAVACQKTDNKKSFVANITPTAPVGAGSAVVAKPLQVQPPLDVKQPPPDAQKLASGLAIKKLKTSDAGTPPGRNDTVKVVINGWLQKTGETFRSSPKGEPESFSLANAAPGFIEGLGQMKPGERAMLWMPAKIGYREAKLDAEDRVYEVELVEVARAPATPADVAGPPATALSSARGTKYVIARAATGDKARPWDTVTFHYSMWEPSGRLVDSSELKGQSLTQSPLKEPAVVEEMLGIAPVGSRVRFWAPAENVTPTGKKATGQLCYELDIQRMQKSVAEPPPKPELKAPADAQKSPKGVAYKVLTPGKGDKPKPTDILKVKYTGWAVESGRVFETWATKGQPFEISLNGTTTGFADVFPLLPIGTKVRLWIPEELGFKLAPGMPRGALVYDAELVGLGTKEPEHDPHHPAEQPAPPDVAAAPKDAKKTASGLAYKFLGPEKKGAHPKETDKVRVHYSGWTTDGKQFDSSVSRGKPAEFMLTGVIKGWTEGLQLMSPGDKVRFWIPKELAYNDAPGKPAGTLVFDVELLEINPAPESPPP